MTENKVKVVESWGALPPLVFSDCGDFAYSTRKLEDEHRKMKKALEIIVDSNLADEWVNLAKEALNNVV